MTYHCHLTSRNLLATALVTAAGTMAAGWVVRGILRSRRYFDFADKTVLITGGSRGLGFMLARRFIDEGAKVAICARDESELARARNDLGSRGGDVLAVQCDVTVNQQVAGMIDGVARHFGSIDVLVNNAGVIQVGPNEHMTLADYEHAMNTHFWAPLYTIEAALPYMKRRRAGGRIINIASIGGKIAVPHLLPYSASKFALVGLSEGMRAELTKENIYVTTVCPGLMRTGSPRNANFKGRHEQEYAWFAAADALPLVSVSADRIAGKIVNAARYGQAQLIFPLIANVQAKVHGLLPGVTSEVLALTDRFLPGPGGIGQRSAKGYESQATQPAFARRRNLQAAQATHEVPPPL